MDPEQCRVEGLPARLVGANEVAVNRDGSIAVIESDLGHIGVGGPDAPVAVLVRAVAEREAGHLGIEAALGSSRDPEGNELAVGEHIDLVLHARVVAVFGLDPGSSEVRTPLAVGPLGVVVAVGGDLDALGTEHVVDVLGVHVVGAGGADRDAALRDLVAGERFEVLVQRDLRHDRGLGHDGGEVRVGVGIGIGVRIDVGVGIGRTGVSLVTRATREGQPEDEPQGKGAGHGRPPGC